MTSPYSTRFYQKRRELTATSARIILEKLFSIYRADSVIDLGCGTGVWLAQCRELGALRVRGIDGDWVEPAQLEIDPMDFKAQNLGRQAYVAEGRYDLALSIEVAEHLNATMGRALVASLVAASDVVLFSAAVVGQGGTGHINEQRQSYWASIFAEHDYVCLDLIRPVIWNDDAVNLIYKQNMLIYVNAKVAALSFAGLQPCTDSFELDRIHPELLQLRSSRTGNKPVVRGVYQRVKRLLGA